MAIAPKIDIAETKKVAMHVLKANDNVMAEPAPLVYVIKVTDGMGDAGNQTLCQSGGKIL